MENITMIPATWQLNLSAVDCATSALASLAIQGIAVRPATNDAFAPFAVAAVASDLTVAKRDRATTGMGHRGIAADVPGPPAWSPPN